MKYRQLTKEQFESLHEEFARFLASQSIDAKEWKQLKEEKPQVAEDEMNVFSDVVWDDVLTRTNYVAHYSKQIINFFKCNKEYMERIVVQTTKEINFLEKEGFEWLLQNPTNASLDVLKGKKSYSKERNVEVFDLIEKGGSITNGEIFEFFYKILS